MKPTYFQRVTEQTPTRFWINNPTLNEAHLAIAAGASGCTCNPSFCQKMLDHPNGGAIARRLLDQAVLATSNDTDAQAMLQRELARPIVELFRPFHQRRPDRDGFVSLQGDPLREDDPGVIVHEAVQNHALGANVCVKIPTTAAGLAAMDELVALGIPINATEIFAVAQAELLCATYERSSRQAGKSPVIFLSHITGIYDDHLRQYVAEHKVEIAPDVLWQAGLAVARKVYTLLVERGLRPIFIGGGARGTHHFTEMVGGDLVVTINWRGTADKLIDEDPPVVSRVFNPVPQRVIDELLEKLPDFRRGYLADGLAVQEFASFGPVELFRSSFVKSWNRVLDLAGERRTALGTTSAG